MLAEPDFVIAQSLGGNCELNVAVKGESRILPNVVDGRYEKPELNS